MKSDEFISEGTGVLPGVYTHETSPENALDIKANGFHTSDVFFNVDAESYTGGQYGTAVVHAKFKDGMPAERLFNTDTPTSRDMHNINRFAANKGWDVEDDEDALEQITDDGYVLVDFCYKFGYWAWSDGLQIDVINTDVINVVNVTGI